MSTKPKKGDLRVWWIPQIPMVPFRVPVKTPEEAILLLNALAKYDLFQLEHNIKPDFSNTGGLESFNDYDDGEWSDWENDEGESIDDYEESTKTTDGR